MSHVLTFYLEFLQKNLKVDLLAPKLSYSKDMKKLAFLYYFRAFSFLINAQYFLKYVTN